MSLFLFSWVIIYHITTTKSSDPHILKDGERWIDDYEVNDNAIDGWRYFTKTNPSIGSDKTYHGWFYLINYHISLGYFYRQFQCEYDSFINVSFTAYFGCGYDLDSNEADGAILYLNEHQFIHLIQSETIHNYTDAIAVNQSMKCSDRYNAGTFVGFTAHQATQVSAFTTVDVGFRMLHLYQALTQEFGAISDISIECNKLNISQMSPAEAPSATIDINISDPSQHIACTANDETTCNQSVDCMWNQYDINQCSCNGSAGVDVLFAVGITSFFVNHLDKQQELKQWLFDDIIMNIDHEKSRFGLLLFDENVSIPIDISIKRTRDTIIEDIDTIEWKEGWLNYELLFTKVVQQFSNIEAPNDQQLFVIVTDNNADTPQTNGQETSLCHYRHLFASLGIRVIVVGIDIISNQLEIENYACITQNSFDTILVTNEDSGSTNIQYDILHAATDVLSASLCPEHITIRTTSTTTDLPANVDITTSIETTDLPVNDHITTSIETTDLSTNEDIVQTTISSSTITTKSTLKGQDSVDFTLKTDANTTAKEITIIVAVIANITGLDSTQISVVSTAEGLRIFIVGTNGEINLAEKSVDEIEESIEELTGHEAEVTHINRTYSDDNDNSDDELKRLLLYLIIAVSVLIFVVIVVSSVCCYCLFVSSKKKKSAAQLKNNADHNQHASIPSKTVTLNDNEFEAVAINVCEINPMHVQNYSAHSLQNSGNSFYRPYANMIGVGSVHRLTIDSTVSEAPEAIPMGNEGDILSVIIAANENNEEEDELNEIYNEQLALEVLHKQGTMTEAGDLEGFEAHTGANIDSDANRMKSISDDDDDNDDMYVKPDRDAQITPRFNAQVSLPKHINMSHLMQQQSFNLAIMNHNSSINLSPHITPVHSAQNTMNLNDLQELSQNLPLPEEHDDDEKNEDEVEGEDDDDDDDVIQDLTPQVMHPLDADNNSHEDLYEKRDNNNNSNNIYSEQSSDDNGYNAMYDTNNKTDAKR